MITGNQITRKNVSNKYLATHTYKRREEKLGRMSEEDKDKIIDLWWDNFFKAPLEEKMSDEEKNKIIDWCWEIFS